MHERCMMRLRGTTIRLIKQKGKYAIDKFCLIQIDLFKEGRLRRNLNEVFRRDVKRLVAADTKIRAGRGDQVFRMRDQFPLGQR